VRFGLGGMIAGTPESGGWSSRELRRIVQSMKGLNIVGMDIVEVARESELYLT
jgi:arginase family enzyme